jgi:hypothetical protein
MRVRAEIAKHGLHNVQKPTPLPLTPTAPGARRVFQTPGMRGMTVHHRVLVGDGILFSAKSISR